MSLDFWLYSSLPILLPYTLTAAVVRFGPKQLSGKMLTLVHFGGLAAVFILMTFDDGHLRPGNWTTVGIWTSVVLAIVAAAVHFIRHRRQLALFTRLYFGYWTVLPILVMLPWLYLKLIKG